MKYYNSEPPTEKVKESFPTFNDAVSVENCWYYLSMLERFVETVHSMSEDVLKKYLVRAEYRYAKWFQAYSYRYRREDMIPPIDVAFFWHAHMISPLRYMEDLWRLPQTNFGVDTHEMPLEKLHRYSHKVPISVQREWSDVMGTEPYHLTEHALNYDELYNAIIHCPVCAWKLNITWENYTDWRTDSTVAIQCHCCCSPFMIKHVGKQNLLYDIDNEYISGLSIDKKGKCMMSISDLNLISSPKDIQNLPFNEGVKSLDEHLKKRQFNIFSNSESLNKERKRITDAIQTTYYCSPYHQSSIDLIQAVGRLYNFAVHVTTRYNWNEPSGIIDAIRQYQDFLAVMKENPNLTPVPSFGIDLAWHVHMMHPTNYRKFTNKYIGRILIHDDNIIEQRLPKHIEQMDKAWDTFRKASLNVKTKNNSSNGLKGFFNKSNDKVIGDPLFDYVYNPGHIYPKKDYNISQHDKSYHGISDAKDFITWSKATYKLEIQFEDVKNSSYGFIGSSTCDSDDYFVKKRQEKGDDIIGTYTRVHLSTGNWPRISDIKQLPENAQPVFQAVLNGLPAKKPGIDPNINWYKVNKIFGDATKLNIVYHGLIPNPYIIKKLEYMALYGVIFA